MPKSFLNHIIGKAILLALLGLNLWASTNQLFFSDLNVDFLKNHSSIWLSILNSVLFLALSFWTFRLLKSKKIIETNGNTSIIFIALLTPFLFKQSHLIIINILYLLLILKWLLFVRIYNQSKIWSECFLIGLIIGVMTIFKVELVLFIPTFWIGIYSIRAFEWRNIAFSIIGFILPWIYFMSFHYIIDQPLVTLEQEIQNISSIQFNLSYIFIQTILGFAILSTLLRNSPTAVHQQKQLRYFLLTVALLFSLSFFIDLVYLILSFPLAVYLIDSNYQKTDKQWLFELGFVLLITVNIVGFLIF